ncbi:tRNA nucleotidyltransferase [Pseudodesulfovibrio thermohalotolerans]|uniref:tRNA nucleotidyltransferase n=1 Tax=Pseudodesulfovibrio thermohalotolerans TaxID=2880651 RepID=UPI0024417A3A|nr:tRNA nucleotidyltransferase [Pseudodesulfovibrio thermohalotolerans]WFS64231.1 tRNA nucleotidyltransferase [Pseudodesulfovibrio thermohalotolerans]
MKLYLAGGAVRDLLLGRPLHDRDYLVMDSSREEFRRAFPKAREVGRTFPIFLINGIEFSFPRADSLEEELKARDLTVNAQLLSEEGELILHPQGFDDIKRRILRPASEHSMKEDPLRVFRAARFAAQLPEFTPHPELVRAMRDANREGLLEGLSADRIGPELRKGLESPRPGNFLRLLAEADCLLPWFPEFDIARSIPAGPAPYHNSDALTHTCRIMDDLAGDPIAVWMGLCHDLGKTLTPPERLPRHYGHDLAGAPLAETVALRLRMSNEYKTAGVKAARWHMIAARYGQLRPATRVDLLMDLHLSRVLAPLFKLVQADHGEDYGERAARELAIILPVQLAPEDRNHGSASGEKLRMLRAQALRNA